MKMATVKELCVVERFTITFCVNPATFIKKDLKKEARERDVLPLTNRFRKSSDQTLKSLYEERYEVKGLNESNCNKLAGWLRSKGYTIRILIEKIIPPQ
jgi:hypothetical protein